MELVQLTKELNNDEIRFRVKINREMDPRFSYTIIFDNEISKLRDPSEQWIIELDYGDTTKLSYETLMKLCRCSELFRNLVEEQLKASGNKLRISGISSESMDCLLEAIHKYEKISFSFTTEEIIDWSKSKRQKIENETIPNFVKTINLFSNFPCKDSLLAIRQALYKAIEGIKNLPLGSFAVALDLFDFLSEKNLNMNENSANLQLLGSIFGEYLNSYESNSAKFKFIIDELNNHKVHVLDIRKFIPGLEDLTFLSKLYIKGNPNISDQLCKDQELSGQINPKEVVSSILKQFSIFKLFKVKGEKFFNQDVVGADICHLFRNCFGQYLTSKKTRLGRKDAINELMKYGVTDIAIHKLFSEISLFKKLQKLTIWGFSDINGNDNIEDETYEEDLSMLQNLSSLTKLKIENCDKLNGDGFINFPSSLKKISLTMVENIPNEAFANLPEGLTHLTIDAYYGSSLITNEVGKFLNKYKSLTSLKISGCDGVNKEEIQKYFDRDDIKIEISK
jgi:hypothetical protein